MNPDEIEAIVGVPRHDAEHYGRAISSEQRVYVLHSRQCKESTPDLRDCPFSIALDEGIENGMVWPYWRGRQDQPMRLAIDRAGYLRPATQTDTGGESNA